MGYGDRTVRWMKTPSMVLLVGIAAMSFYKHMFILVRRYRDIMDARSVTGVGGWDDRGRP